MSSTRFRKASTNLSKATRESRDFLDVRARKKHARADAGFLSTTVDERTKGNWPPVPDLFDVLTYFRARGDSFALIANIGFWVGENPTKALTARVLKLWYEAELERRAAARASIR